MSFILIQLEMNNCSNDTYLLSHDYSFSLSIFHSLSLPFSLSPSLFLPLSLSRSLCILFIFQNRNNNKKNSIRNSIVLNSNFPHTISNNPYFSCSIAINTDRFCSPSYQNVPYMRLAYSVGVSIHSRSFTVIVLICTFWIAKCIHIYNCGCSRTTFIIRSLTHSHASLVCLFTRTLTTHTQCTSTSQSMT